MKSKSFDLKQSSSQKGKNNKTLDFVGLYSTTQESEDILDTIKSSDKKNKAAASEKGAQETQEITAVKLKDKKGKTAKLEKGSLSFDAMGKHTKTFDFVSLYKTVAETEQSLQATKPKETPDNEINDNSESVETPKVKRTRGKKKGKNEVINSSLTNEDGQILDGSMSLQSLASDNHVTSTPNPVNKNIVPKVKSIMKQSFTNGDDTMDGTSPDSSTKRKKRNKSVSFMLEDTEEVAVKKTKSEDSIKTTKSNKSKESRSKANNMDKIKEFKKLKKEQKRQSEKENKANELNNINMETDNIKSSKKDKKNKAKPEKEENANNLFNDVNKGENEQDDQSDKTKKKTSNKWSKYKLETKQKKLEKATTEQTDTEIPNEEPNDNKEKKNKKKKRKAKQAVSDEQMAESEGEPEKKSRKKEDKPEAIAEDLENLSIGDNAHTLTNLLDEMTVVDKNKKKKDKKLLNKKDKTKTPSAASTSSSETADLEKNEEGKEKVKWKKRKWNKGRKGDFDNDIAATVIIENLPISIMLTYKKLLSEHFVQFGVIKKIGIAEVYPTEDSKPIFTTTIMFQEVDAAVKALEEDNSSFAGSRIRIKRPLPPTETTLVVRSYADISEQSLSSVFLSAGRIRSIRHLVKGKKAMATAFIEFDGPEAVDRAVKMAAEAKIGGKKIYVGKFEHRGNKHNEKEQKPADNDQEDSDDSN